MSSVPMPTRPSSSGAAANNTTTDRFALPDLCSPLAVFGVVLASQLLALLLTLAGQPGDWSAFYYHLAQTALLLLWTGLLGAAALCRLRSWLGRFAVVEGSVITYLVVLACVIAVSEGAFWLGRYLGAGPGNDGGWFPVDHWFFLGRNIAVATLVMAPLLRYFYVSQQWQRNVRRDAETRLNALQARIRPHFLFNSMNTIAALIGSNPAAAEQAVEDLADLFRASLREGRQLIPLTEELEIARVYERMEQLRLGPRLTVDWQLGELPATAEIPGLTIQPLLENAIYHGIEPAPEPGVITVRAALDGKLISVSVENAMPPTRRATPGGHGLALDNIRERLALAFGEDGSLAVEPGPGSYTVTIRFPANGLRSYA
ncbi:MAG: sensor histidine kinase [Gammaproteobacteria bacterium PRO9]|nr:sensor histidine kinase [Gammaproteobacteria bacterium PRO9]